MASLSPQQLPKIYFLPLGSFSLCPDAALSALELPPVRADAGCTPGSTELQPPTSFSTLRPSSACRGHQREVWKAGDTQCCTVAETCVFAGFTQMSEPSPELQKMHSKQQVFASYSQWTPLCVCTRLWVRVCAHVYVCVYEIQRHSGPVSTQCFVASFKQHNRGEGPESLTLGIFIPTEGAQGSDSPSSHLQPPRRVTVRVQTQ